METTAILLVAAAGVLWDLRTGRIPNALTIPALVAGFFYALAQGTLASSVAGVLFIGGIYTLLFALGGMGGGDVKLGAALGAWGGLPFSVVMFILASLAGGIQAVWATRHAVVAAALAALSGQGIGGACAAFQAAYHPRQPVPYGVAIGTGAAMALVWPALPGAAGAWGREVYALLAAFAP